MQVYYLWYGGWGNLNNKGTATRPTTVKVLTDMAQSIGGKPWFNIATTYTDQNGPVVNKIAYGGRAGITAGSKCWQVRWGARSDERCSALAASLLCSRAPAPCIGSATGHAPLSTSTTPAPCQPECDCFGGCRDPD